MNDMNVVLRLLNGDESAVVSSTKDALYCLKVLMSNFKETRDTLSSMGLLVCEEKESALV